MFLILGIIAITIAVAIYLVSIWFAVYWMLGGGSYRFTVRLFMWAGVALVVGGVLLLL